MIVLLPLFEGIELSDYTGRRLLVLGAVTFLLATIDTLLESLAAPAARRRARRPLKSVRRFASEPAPSAH